MEEWKDIEGYEGLYQVSSYGRVKSLKFGKERVLKADVNNNGYNMVRLCKINTKRYSIHRLLALTFIPNDDNKLTVNHIDGIKTNNNISNLEWASHSENIQHAVRTNLKISSKGENNGSSKLTEKEVLEIRNSNINQIELGKLYNVSNSVISLIKRRKRWKHI